MKLLVMKIVFVALVVVYVGGLLLYYCRWDGGSDDA